MKRRPFRFLNFWTEWEGFKKVLNQAWKEKVSGNPLFIFSKKLMILKGRLKSWAKERADIPNLLKDTRKQLKEVAQGLQKDPLNPKMIDREMILKK